MTPARPRGLLLSFPFADPIHRLQAPLTRIDEIPASWRRPQNPARPPDGLSVLNLSLTKG